MPPNCSWTRLGRRCCSSPSSLISQAWNSFDQARPGQPTVDDALRAVLREPLPDTPEPVTRALEEAAQILDESIAQPRPRYFAFVGSSGLPIGVVADALASCFDANMAVYAGAASRHRGAGRALGGGADRLPRRRRRVHQRRHHQQPDRPGRRPRAGAAGRSRRGHGRPPGGGLLLGRGPLLGDARGRAARHRRRERAADRARRRPPDGARRACRGARPRSRRGRHAGRRDRDGRHHADRRGRSDRAPGRSLPRARGVAARGRRLRAGGRRACPRPPSCSPGSTRPTRYRSTPTSGSTCRRPAG